MQFELFVDSISFPCRKALDSGVMSYQNNLLNVEVNYFLTAKVKRC